MSRKLRRAIAGVLALGLVAGAWGCAQGARMARVDEQGGVVIYPLKKDRESIYASRFRADALLLIEQHCHGPYLITREGETAPQESNMGLDSEDMLTVRRFWGLEFRCKAAGGPRPLDRKRDGS